MKIDADAASEKLSIEARAEAQQLRTRVEAQQTTALLIAETDAKKVKMAAEAKSQAIVLEAEATAKRIVLEAEAVGKRIVLEAAARNEAGTKTTNDFSKQLQISTLHNEMVGKMFPNVHTLVTGPDSALGRMITSPAALVPAVRLQS